MSFLCISATEQKSFEQFPWYDVFISYILRFFHGRHISKIRNHLMQKQKTPPNPQRAAIEDDFLIFLGICLRTNLPTERLEV